MIYLSCAHLKFCPIFWPEFLYQIPWYNKHFINYCKIIKLLIHELQVTTDPIRKPEVLYEYAFQIKWRSCIHVAKWAMTIADYYWISNQILWSPGISSGCRPSVPGSIPDKACQNTITSYTCFCLILFLK